MSTKIVSLTAEKNHRRDDSEWLIEFKQLAENGELNLSIVAESLGKPIGQIKQKLAAICAEHSEKTIFGYLGISRVVQESRKRGKKRGSSGKNRLAVASLLEEYNAAQENAAKNAAQNAAQTATPPTPKNAKK